MKKYIIILLLISSTELFCGDTSSYNEIISTTGEFHRNDTDIFVERTTDGQITLSISIPGTRYDTSEAVSPTDPFWILWDPSKKEIWFATPRVLRKTTFSESSTKGQRYSLKEGMQRLSLPTILRETISIFLKETPNKALHPTPTRTRTRAAAVMHPASAGCTPAVRRCG